MYVFGLFVIHIWETDVLYNLQRAIGVEFVGTMFHSKAWVVGQWVKVLWVGSLWRKVITAVVFCHEKEEIQRAALGSPNKHTHALYKESVRTLQWWIGIRTSAVKLSTSNRSNNLFACTSQLSSTDLVSYIVCINSGFRERNTHKRVCKRCLKLSWKYWA